MNINIQRLEKVIKEIEKENEELHIKHVKKSTKLKIKTLLRLRRGRGVYIYTGNPMKESI